MPTLIDTHAHLDEPRLLSELPDVLARAQAVGVVAILAVATSAASSRACLQIAQQHSATPGLRLFPSVGLHPNHANEAAPGDWDDIVVLAKSGRAVALGETGLDRHWDTTPFPLQEAYFAKHLALSRETKLPVIIHCREAEADTLRLLQADFAAHGPVRGVMHSFSGDWPFAQACLALGLYISFAGMVTYKNAANLRAVAQQVPFGRLLVETDCPYLAPVPKRGQRNEPAYVLHTAECLAQERGSTVEELGEQTTANARLLFGLPS